MKNKKKFKTLTEGDIDLIKSVYHDKSGDPWETRAFNLGKKFGVSERTIRKWVSEKLKLSEKNEIESPELIKAKGRQYNRNVTRFIITWAQNNTPVEERFIKNMLAYAAEINADFHVIAGRYRNPTSVFVDKGQDFWHPSIKEYLDAARHDVHEFVSIMSDVKIQPTAVNPLTGLQGMSGINSCVFGHPKVQMEMISVLESNKPKMMLSTGACTQGNYTDSKAGKKGEFHHMLGFVVVEIQDDKTFHLRQVTADDDGDFTDLYYNVKFKGKRQPIVFDDPLDKPMWVKANCGAEPFEWVGESRIKKITEVEACILGDLHYGHHDPKVLKKTFKLMKRLTPKHVVLHDVFDGYSISHHAMKDPFIQYGKEINNTNDLGKEIDELMVGLKPFNKFENVVIVRSNHDDFLDRWLKNGDWKKQPTYKNSPLYMEYSAILLKQHGETPEKVMGVIPELINRKFPKFITLDRSDSYRVLDWELGQHGDSGANGSRGSLVQFRKLNTKIIVGHYHCLPAEYKVQTKNSGWKEIRAISVGDEILSYDPNTNRNVWNRVNEFIETDYDGVMLQIKGNGFEQTFTDKHMLMMNGGDYIPASQAICTRSSSELPISALPEEIYGKSIPEKHIRQIVSIAADGSQNGYRIRFNLKKARKIERLKELFGSELVTYTDIEEHFDGYISTRGDLYKTLMEYKYNLKSVKNISVEILEWDNKSLEVLVDELKYWDGTYDTGNNGNQYSTTNKVEANVVSSALNRLGYSHRINKREHENDNHKTLNIITWSSDRNFIRNSKKMNHDSRFNGWGFNSYQTTKTKVYCVSVDNQCFWVQSAKDGTVSLTGNSPGRKDGAIAVGTTTKLRVGYNEGPSSWAQSHVLIHKDGKAQHITFSRDKYGKVCYTTFD
jgi:transposase